mgnify:CR=1 FL=1
MVSRRGLGMLRPILGAKSEVGPATIQDRESENVGTLETTSTGEFFEPALNGAGGGVDKPENDERDGGVRQ